MKVLFLTHRLPFAPNRGDRIRAFHLIRVLSRHADVHVLSLVHSDEEAARTTDLKDLAASVTVVPVPRLMNLFKGVAALPGARPLTHVLLHSPGFRAAAERVVQHTRPDVVLSFCSGMARHAMDPPLSALPMVLDMVDVDSVKWASLATTGRWPMRQVYSREARQLGRFEIAAIEHAHVTTVINEREREALLALAPEAAVRVVPNGIDVASFKPSGPPASGADVVFCGVFDYEPNAAAAVWLATRVWPLVLRRRQDAKLRLVGMNPTARVRGLASAAIEVTGAVADVRPYLWSSAAAVAPLQVARGLQNKVLEAVAAGLQCVVTPAVIDGLPQTVRSACREAASPEDFANAIVELLDVAPAHRRHIIDPLAFDTLSWEHQLAGMSVSLNDAATVMSRGYARVQGYTSSRDANPMARK